MDALTLSRIVSAIALVVGLVFGMIQIRRYGQRRRRESALELVHSFQTPALEMDLIDDFFSGPIEVTWRKLATYIDEGRGTFAEWAQWLAERMRERESEEPPVPAYVAHRRWRPGS